MFVHVCTICMYEHAHAYALMWTCPRTHTIHTCMTAPRACWCYMCMRASPLMHMSVHMHVGGYAHVRECMCVYARVCSIACESMHVCVCVRVCVCVSHIVQWYVQRFPIDRLRVRFPTIMVTHTRLSSLSQTLPDFSFILLGGYQQLVHAGVCGVMCVREKKRKKMKKNEKDQKRDSLARKCHSK